MERTDSVRPRFIAPMLCRQIKTLPHGDDWFYEVKHDGLRALAVKDGAKVTLFARDGKRLDYPEASDAVRKLHAGRAVIDCEIIALDKRGKSCFAALGSNGGDCTIRLYAFDLLHLNGVT
jgi:bifunctional non-homologous end joining protein LigD